MKIKRIFALVASLCIGAVFCSYAQNPVIGPGISKATEPSPDLIMENQQTGPVVDIKTTAGDIKIMLFDDTPLHRDNFLKLVDENYYDGVLFHRVIKDFMIQTGDPESREAKPGAVYGSGGPDFRIDPEFRYPKHFHKKGAVAAARDGNAKKASSASQFYIVTGRVFDRQSIEGTALNKAKQARFNELATEQMDLIQRMIATDNQQGLKELEKKLIDQVESEVTEAPAEVVEAYTTIGGAPHLDGDYTVFGEVLEGLDVVDKIQQAATDSNDRPLEDIKIISMSVQK